MRYKRQNRLNREKSPLGAHPYKAVDAARGYGLLKGLGVQAQRKDWDGLMAKSRG